ncbi:hypothetical protein D2Q93_00095 [Alicyclobacillaceae bacterium I2511]|nr:hypothetical protein D2Q93_00095 [Alicyclobacillaceae bacterium I2511]
MSDTAQVSESTAVHPPETNSLPAHLVGLNALLRAGTESFTPEIVQQLMGTVAGFVETVDRLQANGLLEQLDALSGKMNEVGALMDRVVGWQADGTIDRLEGVIRLLRAALEAFTPDIVQSLVNTVAKLIDLADRLMASEVFRQFPDMLVDLDAVLSSPPGRSDHEFRQLARTMREPDIQDGLELVMELLRRAGRGARTSATARKS